MDIEENMPRHRVVPDGFRVGRSPAWMRFIGTE